MLSVLMYLEAKLLVVLSWLLTSKSAMYGMIDAIGRCWDQWRVDYAGMVGCGASRSFAQLLAWRWVTGLGSALQMSGAQLYLADISASSNRARTMGTNQARMRQKLQTVLIGACNAFCNAS